MIASGLLKKFFLYLLVLSLLLFTGYPFLYMISTSLKSMEDFFNNPFSILPENITFDNYFSVFDMGLTSYFINSIIITFSSVIIVVLIASMASYPLSRMKFKFNRPLLMLFVVGMMLPFHAALIPIFVLTQEMGIYDTLFALLGPYVAFSLPVSVFILTQFMEEVPKELEEAAEVDGASHWKKFWKVLFPNTIPAISTVVIYNFVFLWTEFIFALVLISSPSSMTLPLGLRDFHGEFSVDVPGIMAALTLASLPVILVYLFAQKRVEKGLAGGAVKG
ncbi:raffinose/stachyose/melibiose transport system permease protein [Geomicrobium halophilum]|uniref:Raffinose/stachyose/melibiose transport system permease protein n=1 Tax=Geomicrobium halophilum TaxID=549000 RepID=A0A841PQZ8_9BACL|nr:carbohydrate ABC transporter permease [Geomicrobium halophilum]MBB6451317.1 raffinose/stachyose/melibiose transport system permease protein [Geomicrobium halophilum]